MDGHPWLIRTGVTGSPFLTQVGLLPDRMQHGVHPFTLPLFEFGLELKLTTPITFLVGENGSFAEGADGEALDRALRLGWRQRVTDGFCLRSETFFNFAAYLEDVGSSWRDGAADRGRQDRGDD